MLTKADFLEALRQTPRTWALFDGVRLRSGAPVSLSYTCDCPVTAVAHAKGLAYRAAFERVPAVPFTPGNYRTAATKLDMPQQLADEVVSAADMHTLTIGEESGRALRAELLEACGVVESELPVFDEADHH